MNNSNYKPYSSQGFGSQQRQSSFGQQNNQSGFSSFGNRANTQPSTFGTQSSFRTNSANQFNNSQFGSFSQKPFSSNFSTSGYSLGAQPYQTRPASMNRPISVYGNNTGFYFPRTNYTSLNSTAQYQPRPNNSIMFNNATQPPLVAPNAVSYQPEVNAQQQEYVQDQNQNYEQNSYENQQIEQQYEEPVINYGYIKSVLDELSQSSNSENSKAAVVTDIEGNIIAQGYNFVDEEGNEYQAEDYVLQALGEISWDPNTSIMFTNAPLTEDTANSCVSYGIKTIQVLASSSKQTKKYKKDKGMKVATSILEDNGISVEILELKE